MSDATTPDVDATPPLRFPDKLRAIGQLTRISNLPTVWTNVCVGVAIGVGGPGGQPGVPGVPGVGAGSELIPWSRVGWVGIGISLLYLGGMTFNDAWDVRRDLRERPDKPIPSTRISLSVTYTWTVLFFTLGMISLMLAGRYPAIAGAGLSGTIVGYNLSHQRFTGSVVLMGLCRAWVYTIPVVAVIVPGGARESGFDDLLSAGPILLLLGGILTVYTMTLTLIARKENSDLIDQRRWLAVGLPILVLIAIFGFKPENHPGVVIIGLVTAAWLGRGARHLFEQPIDVKHYVAASLSGICLIDAYFLMLLDRPVIACVAVGCFLITRWGHTRISGT